MLGLAVSGLVLVGPIALFFPENAAVHFGPHGTRFVWLMFVASYALCLILVLMILRPRLIVYNIPVDQLRPILADLVERLDADARWAGDSLALPGLGVQLHLESLNFMRNVALISSGPKQDSHGWSRLEAELAVALRNVEVPRNPRGVTLLSVGIVLIVGLAGAIVGNPQAIARTVFEILEMK